MLGTMQCASNLWFR